MGPLKSLPDLTLYDFMGFLILCLSLTEGEQRGRLGYLRERAMGLSLGDRVGFSGSSSHFHFCDGTSLLGLAGSPSILLWAIRA